MMIDKLQDYWTLVQCHRSGDAKSLSALKILSTRSGIAGRAAARYVQSLEDAA